MDIWSAPIQAGFAAFCLIMLAILFWIIKRLFAMLKNDLHHIGSELDLIKTRIDHLPCVIDPNYDQRKAQT